MKAKRIMAVLLAACMILSAGACQGTENTGESASVKQESPAAETGVSGESPETAGAGAVDTSEEVTLRIYAVGNSGDVHQEELYQRINEITKEKINATIEVTMLSWGDYTTKLPAILASGEDYDLTYTSSWCYYKTEGPKGAFVN